MGKEYEAPKVMPLKGTWITRWYRCRHVGCNQYMVKFSVMTRTNEPWTGRVCAPCGHRMEVYSHYKK
jgi:hypothetical protein